MRRWSFESQCPSSTESFCEQPHNGALKPTLPGGETREWGRVDYPHLWRYKTPGQVVMMLAVESLVLVTCRRAMRSLWHQTIQRCSLPTGECFSFITVLQRYPEIFCLCWDGIHLSLQHCSMASVGALLMFLPVAWTCSPQKAGKPNYSVKIRLYLCSYVILPSKNTGCPADPTLPINSRSHLFGSLVVWQ